jgi:hypothetical protein
VELAALALTGAEPHAVATAALERLAFVGEPLARLRQALADGRALGARLAEANAPSARARVLRAQPPVMLGWLWLLGDGDTRAVLDWYLARNRNPVSLSGDEIMALGVPRGPAVARVLAELRDGRLDGRITDRATEVEAVRHLLAKGG